MGDLTRDPFHKRVGSIYCKNFHQLTISVNGNKLDSQFICNVYRSPHGRKPYVQMFLLDDNGKIQEGADGQPVLYDVEGEIEILGRPGTCGCWRGKRIAQWWHKLNERRSGW